MTVWLTAVIFDWLFDWQLSDPPLVPSCLTWYLSTEQSSLYFHQPTRLSSEHPGHIEYYKDTLEKSHSDWNLTATSAGVGPHTPAQVMLHSHPLLPAPGLENFNSSTTSGWPCLQLLWAWYQQSLARLTRRRNTPTPIPLLCLSKSPWLTEDGLYLYEVCNWAYVTIVIGGMGSYKYTRLWLLELHSKPKCSKSPLLAI